MLFKKEKKVIKLLNHYLEEVGKCLDIAQETIQHYINGEIDKAKSLAKKTRLTESGVDDIRHQIRDQLYSGAYMPLLREDIYRLVESIDKVANAGEAACDFFSQSTAPHPQRDARRLVSHHPKVTVHF